jgi:formate hydrogenlyase subunit 6/NADH:ubiquinone oxidoreductase subunit I
MTIEAFVQAFQVPPSMVPHLSLVVDPIEMELVIITKGKSLTVEEIAESLKVSLEEAEEIIAKAYKREMVNKEVIDGVAKYTAGTFYRRVENFAMYENWGDVPADARDAVIDWQLQEYIKKWKPVIEEIRKDPNAFYRIPNRDVLSLEEALEQVEAAEEFVVIPCDCRSVVMACNNPVETCIRFDEGARAVLDRGNGKRLTKDECKALVLDSDRRGLIHTGRRDYKNELYAMCNCCTCDCYPIRSSRALNMDREYPRAHYVAERDLEKCIQCGLCVIRCKFEAFYKDGSTTSVNGKERENIAFVAEKCWGCGLCSTACPTEAINMNPLREEEN